MTAGVVQAVSEHPFPYRLWRKAVTVEEAGWGISLSQTYGPGTVCILGNDTDISLLQGKGLNAAESGNSSAPVTSLMGWKKAPMTICFVISALGSHVRIALN